MISVVIPLFNKEKSISNTIYSVLSQTFPDFEIVVINDGSTDNSLVVLDRIKDNRITIVSQVNSGVSSARNSGIRHAKYNLIALLDGDDLWDCSFLEEMSYLINSYPDAALYGCGYSFQHCNSTTTTPDLGLNSHFKGYLDYFTYAKNNTLFTSSSVIFRKDAFIEIGEFDSSLISGEDIDLWIRFGLHKNVAFYNKPLAIYKLDGENRSLNRPVSKANSLIWNLSKYKDYENSNPVFKEFLDNWRLANIYNYLTGSRNDVDTIKDLLSDIDLKKYSIIWTILKKTPGFLQPGVYKIWIYLKGLYL